MSAARGRLAEVNARLKSDGSPWRLRRGHGYHYFTSTNPSDPPTAGVCVYWSGALTVEQWLAELDALTRASG